MKSPFELPVEKTSYKDILDCEWFCIRDANRFVIISQLTEEQADYIVQAINSHEKLVEAMKNANVWLGGKMEEPKFSTIWLKKYTQRHNECVKIIEQALKEAGEQK